MNIRKLLESDYIEYLRLINIFRETNFSEKEYLETLFLTKNNSTIFVIELNSKLIGTGTILYEHKFIHNISKIGHIEDICIDDSHRGKGYGKILIDHLIEDSKENCCYKVTLYCEDKLEKFYNLSGLEKKGIQMAKYLK
jgi:glucosamine-phosphate N-acetyltransferase